MMQTIKIRSAVTDDLSSLIIITKKCIEHLNEQGIYQWDDIYPSRKDLNNDILKQTLYTLTSGEKVLGCICINQVEYPGYENANWNGARFLVIHKLIVNPQNENQGLGKLAMRHAEQVARSQNMDSVRLDCFKENLRANTFYQKLGYIIRGETQFRKGMFNLYEKMLCQD